MMGKIALKEEQFDGAEYHFQLASRWPCRKDYEKGMVLVKLANINLRKKDYVRVVGYLDVAEKLKLTARQQSIVEKIRTEVNKHI
mgnify:CR=1 FL=1